MRFNLIHMKFVSQNKTANLVQAILFRGFSEILRCFLYTHTNRHTHTTNKHLEANIFEFIKEPEAFKCGIER